MVGLGVAPVKGTRFHDVERLDLDRTGARVDRAFLVVAAEGSGLLLTTKTPALLRVRSWWEPGEPLRLGFPDGRVVTDPAEPAEPARTRLYDGREIAGRLLDGPAAAALSEFLGRDVRLFRPDDDVRSLDDAPVTVMSTASLALVSDAVGTADLDPRRFRMTITIDGVAPWEEESWYGRELRVGSSVLRVDEPVARCVVTTRDPEAGRTDARVPHALARLRAPDDLRFGVWCDVGEPGAVALGDAVELR